MLALLKAGVAPNLYASVFLTKHPSAALREALDWSTITNLQLQPWNRAAMIKLGYVHVLGVSADFVRDPSASSSCRSLTTVSLPCVCRWRGWQLKWVVLMLALV